MVQYTILALMGIGLSFSTINPKFVYPRAGFESRYFLSNTRPMFTNRLTQDNEHANAYIAVKTEYTVFKVTDIYANFQGWMARRGFSATGSQGGGNWGIRLRLSDNVTVNWEHYSCHTFNSDNNCGSEDFIGMFFHVGFNGHGYDSILGNIIRNNW